MNMTDLKVFIAIIVLREDTTIPANWEYNSSEWAWRKVSIVPSFATHHRGEIDFINGLEIDGFNPESLSINISEIHTADISAEVEKIKNKIQKQYSGEIQILWA